VTFIEKNIPAPPPFFTQYIFEDFVSSVKDKAMQFSYSIHHIYKAQFFRFDPPQAITEILNTYLKISYLVFKIERWSFRISLIMIKFIKRSF
jgi:hypothetical protein